MKLAMNEKTKDWVDVYLRKSKEVIKIKNQLEHLLNEFHIDNKPSKKMKKHIYDDEYDDYDNEYDSPNKKGGRNSDESEEEDDYAYNMADKSAGVGNNAERKKRQSMQVRRIDIFLRVLALLCETYYEHTKQLVEKENIFALVAPIMMDSEEYERDKYFRKRLLKGASILFASITASKSDEFCKGKRVNSVHQALAMETGLVATFYIKLVTLQDEAILKSVF